MAAKLKQNKVENAENLGDIELFQNNNFMQDPSSDQKRLKHQVSTMTNAGPIEELNDEEKERIEYEKNLLKGKSLIDKKRLLADLQK